MKRSTILLADDHAVVRDGLRMMLESEFDVVGGVGDGRAVLGEAERLRPELVLVDVSMPSLNGIEAARRLKEALPEVKVVVLTMHADVTFATEAFEAGALGYVLKSAPSDEIRKAIREVLRGRRYVAPEIADDVLPFLLTGAHQTNKTVGKLTSRQREVLQLLAEGRTSKQIGDVLCVSPRTVEFHKYKMMQELGLHSTADLVRYAMKHGIVAP
jgi:DNA-binding NarL/FixJ family response regulator